MLNHLRALIYLIIALSMPVTHASLGVPSSEIILNPSLSRERLSNLYSPHYLRLLQIIYGSEDIISSGGIDAIEDMFYDIPLEGKSIFDAGCGFGGVDIYLAQRYHVNIIGVDKEPYMILKAQELFAKQPTLLGTVVFQTLQDATTLKEFADNTFDIVCSKEMMYHVPITKKQEYLNEMYRILKPGGRLVIADWTCSKNTGERIKRAARLDGFCHFVTSQIYQTMLTEANFKQIVFRDMTRKYIAYFLNDFQRLKNSESQIRCELGNDTYESAMIACPLWLEAMLDPAEIMGSIFIGTKS